MGVDVPPESEEGGPSQDGAEWPIVDRDSASRPAEPKPTNSLSGSDLFDPDRTRQLVEQPAEDLPEPGQDGGSTQPVPQPSPEQDGGQPEQEQEQDWTQPEPEGTQLVGQPEQEPEPDWTQPESESDGAQLVGQLEPGPEGAQPVPQPSPDRGSTQPMSRPEQDWTQVVSRPEPEQGRTQLMPQPLPPPPVAPPPPVQWPPPEPPRAVPERIGPPPPPRPVAVPDRLPARPQQPPPAHRSPQPPPPEPPRRRRALLGTLLALVLVAAVAAGVVLWVPGVAERLGLAEEEPVATAPPPDPVRFTPRLRAPGKDAPAPTPEGVHAALSGPVSAPELGTLTGSVMDPVTGEVLWQQGADTPLAPASTGKLLTAAAALLSLEHTKQLTTTVVEGDDPGTVVVVGGGDPTLSTLKPGVESVYPGAAHLTELANQVKHSAGGTVDTVLVDLSRYTGDSMAAGWSNEDIGLGYIAPIVPAMVDGGRADATAQDGTRTGNPARALAIALADRLGAGVPASASGTAPHNAKVLGTVRSAPMVELVDTLLRTSDNVLAETVAREVAIATGAEPSFEGASRAMLDVLRRNGFDVSGVTMADASGLSTLDRVPAGLLAEILSVAAGPDGADPRTAKLRPLLGGLPVAGGSGTLADRYQEPGAVEGRGWVRAKTGTLSGVNSLAGVVLDTDGRLLVFALMTSGSSADTARPALDAVAATLRNCGCR